MSGELETERQNLRTSIQNLRTAIIEHADNLAAMGEDNIAHRNNKSNPHNTTKNQVGLGLVENYPVATTQDMIDGTSLTHYVTPALLPAGFEAHANAVVMELDIRPPRNKFPEANGTVAETTPTFQVSSFGFSQIVGQRNPVSKVFQIDTANGDFSNPLITQVVPYYDAFTPTLTANTSYKWRCKFVDDQDTHSEWSLPTVFEVLPAKVNKPSVTAPIQGTTLNGKVVLQGSAFSVSSGSHTHSQTHWQVATDAGFTQLVYDNVDTDSQKTLDGAERLANNTTHYVRVRYRAEDTLWSLWSNTVSFTYEMPSTFLITAPVRSDSECATAVYDDIIYQVDIDSEGTTVRLTASTLSGEVLYTKHVEVFHWSVSGIKHLGSSLAKPLVATADHLYLLAWLDDNGTQSLYYTRILRSTGEIVHVRKLVFTGMTNAAGLTDAGVCDDNGAAIVYGGLNSQSTGFLVKIDSSGTLDSSAFIANVGSVRGVARNTAGYTQVLTAGDGVTYVPHLIRSETANTLLTPYNSTDYRAQAIGLSNYKAQVLKVVNNRAYIGGTYGNSPYTPCVHMADIASTDFVNRGYLQGGSGTNTGQLKDIEVTGTTVSTVFYRPIDGSTPKRSLQITEQAVSFASYGSAPTIGSAGFCWLFAEECLKRTTLDRLSNGAVVVSTGIINNIDYTATETDVLPVWGLSAAVANQPFPYHLGVGLVEASATALSYVSTNTFATSVDAIVAGGLGVSLTTTGTGTLSVDTDAPILTVSEM